MRILHVWDIGGDSYLLAKYQKKLGHDTEVVKRHGFDPYGICGFYGGMQQRTRLSVNEFYLNVILKSRRFDIIHVHAMYEIVPMLRKFYPKKKIILHYHGSDCRTVHPKKRLKAEMKSNAILISTPDLKGFVPDGIYIPNPIDLEHFKPSPIKSSNAFTILVRGNTLEPIRGYLLDNNYDIKFDVVYSQKHPIPYADMPKLFSKYGTFIDLKFSYDGNVIPTMSNTGRQALACGLKVLNHDLKLIDRFPDEFRPENVVDMMEKIYAS